MARHSIVKRHRNDGYGYIFEFARRIILSDVFTVNIGSLSCRLTELGGSGRRRDLAVLASVQRQVHKDFDRHENQQ
ncbi:MAG: hypothetical protein Cons2KO_26870 [Congregibacter sp.]